MIDRLSSADLHAPAPLRFPVSRSECARLIEWLQRSHDGARRSAAARGLLVPIRRALVDAATTPADVDDLDVELGLTAEQAKALLDELRAGALREPGP